MAEEIKPEDVEEEPPIPLGQKMFDNIVLLFILSMFFSMVLYNAWGLLDLARLLPAN